MFPIIVQELWVDVPTDQTQFSGQRNLVSVERLHGLSEWEVDAWRT